MINVKANRRQPSVNVNNSNDSPNKSSSPNRVGSSGGAPENKSSSGETGSSGEASSSDKASTLGEDSSSDETSSLWPDDQRSRIGPSSRSKPKRAASKPTNRDGRLLRKRSNLSSLDKLIETHLSLRGQFGGHLETSKMELSSVLNEMKSDMKSKFKELNSDQNSELKEELEKLNSEINEEQREEPRKEQELRKEQEELREESRKEQEELNSEIEEELKEEPNSELKQLNSKQRPIRLERRSPDHVPSKSRAKRSVNQFYFNAYDEALPASYPRRKDWRESNAISQVDNQGVCGACWAHSTLETVESMAGEWW